MYKEDLVFRDARSSSLPQGVQRGRATTLADPPNLPKVLRGGSPRHVRRALGFVSDEVAATAAGAPLGFITGGAEGNGKG